MLSRREWIALWPAVHVAAQQARTKGSLEFFDAAGAAEVAAIAARIIPTDETPGATEAGVIHFIDRALCTFHRDRREIYTRGLADLFARWGSIAKLPPERQDEILRSIQDGEFFKTVRMHTVMGFLADPEYGGNQGRVGWELIGFSAAHVHRPPFGYYDREDQR